MSLADWLFGESEKTKILNRVRLMELSIIQQLNSHFGAMKMNFDEAAAQAEKTLATLNKAKSEIVNNVTVLKDEIAKLEAQIGQQVPDRLKSALGGLDAMATAMDALNEDAVVTPPTETTTTTDATGTDTLTFPEVSGGASEDELAKISANTGLPIDSPAPTGRFGRK